MKSDVKKKMMLDEHTTHTPKSQKRAQVENFAAQNVFTVCAGKNSIAKLDDIVATTVFSQYRVSRQSCRVSNASAPTEFIFSRPGTSIINRHEIIAGAHKWPLSTML
jgi:hypothetical protein